MARHQLSATLGISAAALLLLLAMPLLDNPFRSVHYYGRDISGQAPEFLLRDVQSRPVRLSDFRGKYVYLMFGYLGCEDVCHTQALSFYGLKQQITSQQVHFVYIGMDPENDTAEKISVYFDARDESFTGLIADSLAHAQRVAADYYAYFTVAPDRGDGLRRIDHPGYVYLIDPAGKLRLVYSGSALNLKGMIDDLNKIAAQFS